MHFAGPDCDDMSQSRNNNKLDDTRASLMAVDEQSSHSARLLNHAQNVRRFTANFRAGTQKG